MFSYFINFVSITRFVSLSLLFVSFFIFFIFQSIFFESKIKNCSFQFFQLQKQICAPSNQLHISSDRIRLMDKSTQHFFSSEKLIYSFQKLIDNTFFLKKSKLIWILWKKLIKLYEWWKKTTSNKSNGELKRIYSQLKDLAVILSKKYK